MLPETILAFHLLCTSGLSPVAPNTAPTEIVITGTLITNPNLVSSAPVNRMHAGESDEVAVEIIGAEGRIRMPGSIKPGARGSSSDGWRRLDRIRITDDEIRANVSLDVRNPSSVRIDRRKASISVRGRRGNFIGQCRAADAATTPRPF